MSNKSRLQTNNTNLQALIDKANALPDAGSGGGGSVETCTVTFNKQGMFSLGLYYTSLENDSIIGKMYSIPGDEDSATITALQGSVITITPLIGIGSENNFGMDNCEISNDGSLLNSVRDDIYMNVVALAIQLPNANTCTITCS